MAYLARIRRHWLRAGWLHASLLALLVTVSAPAATAAAQGPVFVTDVQGAIGVAAHRQLVQAIETAQAKQAAALIVRLDTPGGLVSATRTIIQALIASPVPIVVYVAPSGARAASAGTFIVYAAHIAAMAPGTNIGAATPIEIGGLPGLPQPKGEKDKQRQQDGTTTAERKAINDVVAMLRGLAQLRGRNAEWAEKAVREAATLTANEALKERVIEIVAPDLGDLLAQVDGRKVTVNGQERILATKGAALENIAPDWRTRLLAVISDPNVAFILLMIGVYGILLEFWNPTTFISGTVGAIALILALMALTILPVHYGALGLLLLGIALMIGEALTGSVVLGLGGIIAFIVGAIFLFEGPGADISFAISLPLIIGLAATSGALIFGVITAALKARGRPPATGAEELIGSIAQVVEWPGSQGSVRVHGEIWAARSEWPLKCGDRVRVVGRKELTLMVEP